MSRDEPDPDDWMNESWEQAQARTVAFMKTQPRCQCRLLNHQYRYVIEVPTDDQGGNCPRVAGPRWETICDDCVECVP